MGVGRGSEFNVVFKLLFFCCNGRSTSLTLPGPFLWVTGFAEWRKVFFKCFGNDGNNSRLRIAQKYDCSIKCPIDSANRASNNAFYHRSAFANQAESLSILHGFQHLLWMRNMGMSLGPYAEFSKQFEKSRVGRWMLEDDEIR